MGEWFEPFSIAEGLGCSQALAKRCLKDLGIERPKGLHENEKLRALMYRLRNFDRADPEWWQLPPTRRDAVDQGVEFYWDGHPCSHKGHISKKRANNCNCYCCEEDAKLEKKTSDR